MNISLRSLGSYGRLGNQMFQYAALRGIAALSERNWKIPKPGTGTDDYGLFEAFEMSSVKEENLLTNENYEGVNIEAYHCVLDLYLEILRKNQIDLDLSGNYFQSWKYFEHIKDTILTDFAFKDDHKSNVDNDYIFMHVRRGDYVKLQDYHPLCSKEYYLDSLKKFPNHLSVRIFSDDLDWCRENFKDDRFIIKDYNKYFDKSISLPTGVTHSSNPYKDLYLMSQAKGAIIANSSLSWWGAYLIKNKEYPIVFPKSWFGKNLNHDTSDLIPF